jgi:hypothetical protein
MLYVGYATIVWRTIDSRWQKLLCWLAIGYYWLREDIRRRTKRIAKRLKKASK